MLETCKYLDKSDRGTGVSSQMLSIPNLKELTVGPLISSIPFYIGNLNNLELLKILNNTPPDIYGVTESQYVNLVVEVPEEALEAYKADKNWGKFWNLQASGVDGVRFDSEKEEIGRYDMNGRVVSEDYQGLVMVRFSDGSTKKYLQQ